MKVLPLLAATMALPLVVWAQSATAGSPTSSTVPTSPPISNAPAEVGPTEDRNPASGAITTPPPGITPTPVPTPSASPAASPAAPPRADGVTP